ncbi:MAG: pyridoxamine 5'-phosphate oxidase family protein [Desulfovibrio sp.]|nr:pyridoxamine 5'-phosphate oxidase family protein [Desulfovibrio sp.]MBI4961330.1 pyridoxamine 5'-phosphate oxidase family protein [Desulfovibrio sp.]
MTPEDFEKAVTAILDSVPVMTLATCAGGSPWATDVYFARIGFGLVFYSSPGSRHCLNLAANPACAATAHPAASSWQDIRGLQMEGEARPITQLADKVRATAAYLARFPFAKALMSDPSQVARSMAKAAIHEFLPSRIRYLDNALGFGARFTMSLGNGKLAGSPQSEADA